ncbi:MAG: hypothetical protein ABI623_03410 [bacterium]
MKLFSLGLQFVVTAYAAYLLWFLAFEYYPADPLGFTPPFVLWVIDTINLFIHEAGHLIFRLFGQTVSILGGSLMQCLIPLALVIVTWREKPYQAGLPLFWLGENLVNVSVYIADAPHRNLKLIKDGLIHDWHWLLVDHLDWAEPMGLVIRGVGLAICLAAVGWMVFYWVRTLRESTV